MGQTTRARKPNHGGGRATPQPTAASTPTATATRAGRTASKPEPANSGAQAKTGELDVTIVMHGNSARLVIVANGEVRYDQAIPRDKLHLRAEVPVRNALAAVCRELEQR